METHAETDRQTDRQTHTHHRENGTAQHNTTHTHFDLVCLKLFFFKVVTNKTFRDVVTTSQGVTQKKKKRGSVRDVSYYILDKAKQCAHFRHICDLLPQKGSQVAGADVS